MHEPHHQMELSYWFHALATLYLENNSLPVIQEVG